MSSHPGFWGGSSVLTGKARRLSATSFREVVERYVNLPVAFPMTRDEFRSLDEKERNAKKDSAFITACAFVGENEAVRNDANATHTVASILDLDEGDFVKDFDEHPETIAEHLYPFSFVCWRTASWTKENPRLKIMVDVAPCHPSNHRRIRDFLASRLGIPSDFKGVRESGVISQPQYRPLQFRGEDFTAVIASRTTGIPVHLSDLPELEIEEEELINGRTYACDPNEAEDEFFGLAYLPVAGLKPADISEALNAIDPDCDYKTWIEVAAAMRHQFTEEEDAHEVYEMFVEWSSRGVKFAGRRDCWAKWKSFRPYAKGRAPISVRTLYKHAMTAGWDNVKVAKKISQTITEWFAECQSVEDLMLEGAKRIAAVPFRNDAVEEALIIAWRKRIVALGGENIDKATLKKQLTRVRREDKQAKQDARGADLPTWLRPQVYVATSDTFNNLGNGIALKPAAFDRMFAMHLMPKEGEIPANGVPIMQPSAYALNMHKILRVEETRYDPTQKEDEKIFECKETGRLLLNTYDFNTLPVPDPEFAPVAEKLIRQAVSVLAKEEFIRELLLDYLALQVQFPGRKIPWSFLFQSAPGVGKGTLGEIIEAVLGPSNVKIVSPTMMSASFNEWAVGSAFAVFNEVHIPGERRDQVMNAIKPLISDPTIAISLKHRDGQCRVKNVTNYIAFTNEKTATHLAAEDRRWCIVFSYYQTRAQVLALQATGHFDQIRWLTTPAGASALRYFLMKRVISEDFPLTGHAPDTAYRSEVVMQSKNTLQIAIEDCIEDGDEPLISAEVIHDGRLKEKLCPRNPREASLLTRYLSLIGYERTGQRIMLEGSRGHLWTHTERWTNGKNPIEHLKERMRQVPELEADEEIGFS